MGRTIGQILTWVIILGGLYYAYRAGWITAAINYFNTSYQRSQQEEVIEHDDGSITTIKHRSIFTRPDGR